MLQVLESCAHVWDPNSVYIEAVGPQCKHYWDPKRVHSSLKLVTYQGPEDDRVIGRNM